MRIFNKMKKAMLVMMASLFCANVAFAESKSFLVAYGNMTAGSIEGTEGNNQLTGNAGDTAEGIVLQLTGNTGKAYSGANKVSLPWEGETVQRTTIKLSNGAQNTLTMPEGWLATKATFYSYVNLKEEKFNFDKYPELGYRVSYWKEVAGTAYTQEDATIMDVFVEGDLTNPDAISFDLDKVSSFTFTNTGEQACFVIVIEAETVEAEPETEKAYATFEAPTNTNAIWNAETNSFTWTQGWYNQIRNIGLPTGDITKYAKLVVDCEIVSGTQFRILFYKQEGENEANKQLFISQSGVTEIDIVEELKKLGDDYMSFLTECKEICLSGAGDAGEVKINSVYLETAPAGAVNLTAYNEAVAAAEAFKATLNAEDVIEADIIMVMDETIVAAAQWMEELKAEGEYTQGNVDDITADLNANTAKWSAYIEMRKAEAAAQEVLMRYPEESRIDNAGLIDALKNLPLMVIMETAESLQAHTDAVNTACAAFEKENNQLILDAAKKKAADYAATLDASEETGTMAQMEAYGTLTYYTSDDFFTESGITADNYEMVMSYSQQIDMMIAQYDPMIQQDKKKSAAKVAVVEAQNTMALYEGATDEAGLTDAIAKVNEILNELNMWDTMYTLEDLNAAVSALAAARVEFVKENGLQTGTYWLKNVASGKFITAGEHWGTCAVFGDHGMDFDFALQEDGTFIIDSKLSNGGASHYFGAEGWMDAASTKWSLEKLPNGAYTITANGTGYLGYDAANVWNAQTKVTVNMTDNTAETAQWKVLSKEDMVASLEGASLENPADATFFISCPNFGRNDTRFPTAWQGGPARNGANDNMNAERWNANFDVYQDLNGLPNGLYKVSVQGYYRAGNGGATSMEQNAYLYANENTTPLVNINSEAGNVVFEGGNVSDVADMGIVPNNQPTASTGFTAGLYADNTVDVWVNDGTLRIGVKKDVLIQYDWTCFDNFELTYYGSKLPSVTSEVVNVLGKHRLVALASDCIVPTEIFYSFDEAMTEPAIYTAPFYVSETTTVYAYAQFIDEETRERFTSDVVAIEIEAGAEVALNAPVVEQVGKSIVITSDQSDVLNAPADTIEYAVYKKNAESGAYETAPYVSGIYVGALAIDWISGDYKVVAKSVAFGYATAESAALEVEVRTVAYLCGAKTTTEAIYTALDNSGLYVTPLNYDGVTLTDVAVDELAAEYDLVVLAGATGSSDALAKSANLLIGKVNVLSTKSFWYKHYGTNGDNPGTADAPSRSLVKTVADHPIFAGIEGNEFEVFNDMAKENGRYLQKNGSFNDAVGLTQTTLAQTNGTDCIGEGWLNGYGYLIVPVDGAQPAGYLTAAGETLFANAAWYLIEGNQYAGSGSVTDNPFGIDVTTTEEIQWPADIYDIKGRMVKKEATSLEGLQSGLYLIKGQKVLVK